MIQLVVFGLLFSAVVINGSPVSPKHSAVNVAAEARRLVHQANWASVGTISTSDAIQGYPMVTLLSTADSKVGASSTGDIFFYMMDRDITALDVKENNKVTFMFSDAQEGECNKRNDDPWSHRCPRTMISGQVKKLEVGTEEYDRGLEAFVSRHPTASTWATSKIPGHNFYLCKLEITNVLVFSAEGYKSVTPENYFIGTDPVDA